MIRIGQVKLKPNHSELELKQKVAKLLHLTEYEILQIDIRKQSLDARKKPLLQMVYTLDVQVANEASLSKKDKGKVWTEVKDKLYQFPQGGEKKLKHRPVIIGSGPAGLFCAYLLSEYGYRPIVYERGSCVEERAKDIETFWETGLLNPESNVQFGEGGAGTFSDGKLNTLVKDAFGRNRKVLEIFVENGAPKEILYQSKPHIGTDILLQVVKNMRERICANGGEFYFNSKFIDFSLKDGSLQTISIQEGAVVHCRDAETLVLAIGHSARDTFEMLYQKQIEMRAKPFAVGVRIEHLQQLINDAQYGVDCPYTLPSASYKVTANLENGRGVYSFCMCPGGYVVNASSEENALAVNGMSYHARDGKNANSAVIVTVSPEDFGSEHPLAGIEFQRGLEKKAYLLGEGKVPVQRFEDFCENRISEKLGMIIPQIKGAYTLANVREIFPEELAKSLICGIESFDTQIQGFANPDAVVSGIESRTSSPVRILRGETLQIENTGIYPCGEGAGYAGGIMSAAMDGIKVAEEIGRRFASFDKYGESARSKK
ncbi:MAG: NAD(P)-binding protein [Faecalimonas sp.]|nr:NAD(P)-binding protein [Faecalimonas sp.]